MNSLAKAALILALLGTTACTRADRFGDGAAGGAGAGAQAGAGINSQNLGGASDPSSPAYFNETVGDRVLFPVDQSSLTAQAQATLDGQARWLQQNPDYQAVIEGHADEQGTREYNLALGARRANAVREYLETKGIPAARLRTVSYGKERPIAVCSEESCYAKNRRAVTVISISSLS